MRNFRGYFRGAGEHRTVIDCLRGLDPTCRACRGRPGHGPGAVAWPFLVGFVGGNVSVSDLSFHTTAASPAVPTDITSDVLQAIVLVMGNANASSDFYRVAITAGPGDDHGYDADEDLIIMGYAPTDQDGNPTAFGAIHGSESVRDCSFTGHDGIQVQGLTAGRLAITGSVFDDWAVGCLLDDSAGASRIVVCDNRMQADAWGCVALDQGWQAAGGAGAPLPPLPAPHCLIADNVMLAGPDLSDGSIVSGANGVFVEDDSPLYGAPDRLDAVIAHNRITLDNCGFDGGIDGIYARGIKVLGNRISGVGLLGHPAGLRLLPLGHAVGALQRLEDRRQRRQRRNGHRRAVRRRADGAGLARSRRRPLPRRRRLQADHGARPRHRRHARQRHCDRPARRAGCADGPADSGDATEGDDATLR